MVSSVMDMMQCWPPGHALGEVLCNSTHLVMPWQVGVTAMLTNYGCVSESLLIVLVHLCGREISGIPVLVFCSGVLGSGQSWMV